MCILAYMSGWSAHDDGHMASGSIAVAHVEFAPCAVIRVSTVPFALSLCM